MRKLFLLSLFVVLFLGVNAPCFAQGGTGELMGAIYDPSGAVIVGAKVALTNTATGAVREAVSGSAGLYRFTALPVVGTYTLAVDHEGFHHFEVSGIVVSVGLTVTQDVHMELGVATQTVTVEAGTVLVNTAESQVSELVDSRVWKNMPLEVRNQNTFINLSAGVVPNDVGGTTRGAAVNGARPGMGNFLVEGFDNNDQGQGGRGSEGSGAITSISPEAIQEYRVISHSYSAEYGKGGGFVTDTVLKAGTNELHGSAFEYNRVQALAANNFFSNAAGLQDSLVRNQFGGSLGGAIVKDKTFFFASYEAHRRREASPLTGTGVTQDFLDFVNSGAFQTFMESDPNGFCMMYFDATCPGEFSQSASLGPIFNSLKSSQPFPLAQRNFSSTGQGFYTSGFAYPVNVYGDVTVLAGDVFNQHRVSAKIDHKLSNKDQLTGTFLYTHEDETQSFTGADTTIGPPFVNPARSVLLGIAYTRNFTLNVLNQFRVSYLRRRSDYPNAPGAENVPSIVTLWDPLTVGFGNASALPQFFTDNQFQYKDDLSVIHGKHSFKFGGEYRRTRNGSSFEANKNGLFEPYGVEELLTDGYFGDVADLLLNGEPVFGSIGFAQASINPITGGFPEYYRGYRANEIAWYMQDDWKIHPRLTLNLGLRWEYFGPPHNFQKGLDSNIYFGSPLTPVPVVTSNVFYPLNSPQAAMVYGSQAIQTDHDVWHKDTNNFAPRIGFSWDVLGTQKLVLRGGGGFFFDRIWNNLFENIRFNPPFFSFASLGYFAGASPVGPLETPGVYAAPFTNTQIFQAYAALPAPRHMDQNLVTPYTQQLNLGIQWGFAKDYVLEINGAYTGGRELTGVLDINTYNGRTACSSTRAACTAAFTAGDIPTATFSSRRVNSSFAGDNFRTNGFNSSYSGLQVIVRKNFGKGLQFSGNYTWSHTIDTVSDAFNNARGAVLRPTDNFNIALDRGNADFDIRHRVVWSGYYELPFFKENRWLGGWSTSGILVLQKGVPIPIQNGTTSGGGDTNRDGYATDRPVITGDPYVSGGSPADGWLTTGAFSSYVCPTTVNFGLWCDSPTGRNTLRGPGLVNTDFGLGKKFKLNERLALQFQANFFNLFNHPNFGVPSGNRNGGTFGRSTYVFGNPRVTQLALRLDF